MEADADDHIGTFAVGLLLQVFEQFFFDVSYGFLGGFAPTTSLTPVIMSLTIFIPAMISAETNPSRTSIFMSRAVSVVSVIALVSRFWRSGSGRYCFEGREGVDCVEEAFLLM